MGGRDGAAPFWNLLSEIPLLAMRVSGIVSLDLDHTGADCGCKLGFGFSLCASHGETHGVRGLEIHSTSNWVCR